MFRQPPAPQRNTCVPIPACRGPERKPESALDWGLSEPQTKAPLSSVPGLGTPPGWAPGSWEAATGPPFELPQQRGREGPGAPQRFPGPCLGRGGVALAPEPEPEWALPGQRPQAGSAPLRCRDGHSSSSRQVPAGLLCVLCPRPPPDNPTPGLVWPEEPEEEGRRLAGLVPSPLS